MKKKLHSIVFVLIWLFLTQAAQAQDIYEASQAGDLAKVKALLHENPALLEIKNENGKTPLHFAAEGGNPEMIQFLLEGAEINARNIAGETPLHYAAGWSHLEAVRLLLDSGSDLNLLNKAGQSFLGMAVLAGRQQLIDLAFARGAEISPQEGTRMLIASASAGNLPLVEKLLGLGAIPDAEGEQGARLLHAAAASGHAKLVNDLIEQGADLRSKSSRGSTLLHRAAQGNLIDLGKRLLALKIELDEKDGLGRTALQISRDWGHGAFAELLISAGANELERPVVWLTNPAPDTPPAKKLDIIYIANEGFWISDSSKAILVDALFQNPWGYLNTPRPALEKMKASALPFKQLDIVMFSHAHRDHFEPQMTLDLIRKRNTIRMIGNSVTIGELKQTAGTDFSDLSSRITDLNPDWGTIQELDVAGVKIKAFPVNHAEADRPYVTLGFLIYLDGFVVLHLGDINPTSNADIVPQYRLEEENIDIAFIDPFFLQSETGQALLMDHIRPKKIILMHMRPNEVDNYARDLGQKYDNLIVFHVPLQRKTFGK